MRTYVQSRETARRDIEILTEFARKYNKKEEIKAVKNIHCQHEAENHNQRYKLGFG